MNKRHLERNEEDGPKVWRRSVYIYRKRGLPFPMLESFDLPDQNISCGARVVSTVPTQALMLMNDEFVVKQAELFAGRVREAAAGKSGAGRSRVQARRGPLARRRKSASSALEYLQTHDLAGFAHVLLNLNEFVYLR